MTILITGGAGYIGSHVVYEFLDTGHDIVVVDDLSTGNRDLLPDDITFYKGNVGDADFMDDVFSKHKIDTVIHFAGSIIVSESVENPLKYYQNNTVNSLNLINSCLKNKIKNFIFSSTASLYGSHHLGMISEDSVPQTENPYATSKLMTEMMLQDASKAHGLNYIILRYFNVAGADAKGRTGQITKIATHLIKVACHTAIGLRPNLQIFGTDYATHDGTCIRDYIHVTDLANAHLKAYEAMGTHKNKIYNCGYGRGFSVKEVIANVEKVIGNPLPKIISDRRQGDPLSLIANPNRLKQDTGWTPVHDNLDKIITSALAWEKSLISKK